MTPSRSSRRAAITATLALCTALTLAASHTPSGDSETLFAETFDTHWERLRDDYPYFELYRVDWEAERAEHRPRAVAATDATEFAWELARLFSVLPDPSARRSTSVCDGRTVPSPITSCVDPTRAISLRRKRISATVGW